MKTLFALAEAIAFLDEAGEQRLSDNLAAAYVRLCRTTPATDEITEDDFREAGVAADTDDDWNAL